MKTTLMATALVLLVTACGGGGGGSLGGGNGGGNGGGSPTPPVASVTVSPDSATLNPGETMQLNATLKDSSGKVLQGRAVTWTSEDATRVSVTATGRVQAIVAGRVNVTAAAGGKTGTAQIVVAQATGQVSRVELSETAVRIEEGDRWQLTATAYNSSNQALSGRGVEWVSGDPGTVEVAPGGLVTGLRAGIVSVTARIEGKQASATVRVFADYNFELIFGKAAIAAPTELYTLDLRDPIATELPVFAPGQRASQAAPSPDGSRIAFVVQDLADPTHWQSNIYVANRDGSNATRLTTLPARYEQPAWSPDGSRIAFVSRVFGFNSEIWTMGATGGNLMNLTADQLAANKSSPAWSPELAPGVFRIAYQVSQGGTGLLWTMQADGSNKLRVTVDPNFYDDEPDWSPDGTTLVFRRVGTAVFGDLYLVGSTGGSARALMPAAPLPFAQFSPSWSPDGQLIAFTSKHGAGNVYQVWTIWADGTRLAQRTFDLQEHTDPAWLRY